MIDDSNNNNNNNLPPLTLSLIVATWFHSEWARCVESWRQPTVLIPRMGILDAYQEGYDRCQSDILAYFHDDLLALDPDWLPRVLAEFADPSVAIVGFAGAPGYGHPEMYKNPYHHSSLGRVGFASNLVNAEQHGARFTGAKDVVVLDGLALICRRSFLSQIGGWEWRRAREGKDEPDYNYYLYSEALVFHALRLGYRIRLVGIAVEHLDHRSTGLNPNLKVDFEGEHRRLFEEFSDVMPAKVREEK